MSVRRIDTHQHIVPPAYAAWLERMGQKAGGLPIPDWNAEDAIAFMDRYQVETGILSVSTPGVHLGDDQEARRMARLLNDYCASVVARNPGRFGFFATLTLPDVEGSLAELAYAYDVLHADGVALLANVDGIYLGDPRWDPLFDELERRQAVVFIHPSTLKGAEAIEGLPPFAADFLLDTTRAAIRLCTPGTMQRCPNVKVILAHAGGFLPYAAARIVTTTGPAAQANGIAMLASLKRFYFDTALSASQFALPSLLAFAEPGHVTFGSDWPYAPDRAAGSYVSMFERFELDPGARASIDRGAAETLFPRFATRS
jgi:predicted TIM-barrel fold metal-dependent hydrolase